MGPGVLAVLLIMQHLFSLLLSVFLVKCAPERRVLIADLDWPPICWFVPELMIVNFSESF